MLNALFQDKFSEVSMRRTTAGINFFRITSRKKDEDADDDKSEWKPDTERPREASSTLKETIADNQVLRASNVIKEKTFDIELDEPLCEMRPDTSLVIVDVPGLNEAGTSDMYTNYVSQQWDTYDCVVVVMDAEKGVNTEEQVSLLNFVKARQQTSKDVPVIVLCNKVDDPENEEIAVLVKEVQRKVEEVFEVDCRRAALDKILNPSNPQASTPDAQNSTQNSETKPDAPTKKPSGEGSAPQQANNKRGVPMPTFGSVSSSSNPRSLGPPSLEVLPVQTFPQRILECQVHCKSCKSKNVCKTREL